MRDFGYGDVRDLGGFQDWVDCGGTVGFGDVAELGLRMAMWKGRMRSAPLACEGVIAAAARRPRAVRDDVTSANIWP
jgi:hypothetical protein